MDVLGAALAHPESLEVTDEQLAALVPAVVRPPLRPVVLRDGNPQRIVQA